MLLKLWEALAGTIILIKYTMAALDEVERLDCQGNLVGKPTQLDLECCTYFSNGCYVISLMHIRGLKYGRFIKTLKLEVCDSNLVMHNHGNNPSF